MGALVPVNAPVAGEAGGDAGGAGAVDVAVKEGEVGGHEVRALLQPYGQFACEVGLSTWDHWKQIVSDKDDWEGQDDDEDVPGGLDDFF